MLLFDIMLHLGTLMAVTVYFRRDLRDMAQGVIRFLYGKEVNPSARLLVWIVLATIPTGLMGVLLKDWFESSLRKSQTGGSDALYHRNSSSGSPAMPKEGTAD